MKLWECLKTGRKVMRPNFCGGFNPIYKWWLGKDDWEADDWEVEPEPKKQRRVFLWEYLASHGARWIIEGWSVEPPLSGFTHRKSPLCPDGILEDVE